MTTLPRKRHVHVWSDTLPVELAAQRYRTLLSINPKCHPDEARVTRWCHCGVFEEARLNPWVRLSGASRPRKPRATQPETSTNKPDESLTDQMSL